MSERKVLNKYYPIDYDPRRLPRQKGMGNIEDKIMVIRTMAPFHMRCKTCGNYIYRGTKFNSRVETVKGERYLGTIPIRRFYIKCPKCVATITFKTDPENQDYAMETGATRNFEANRMWQLMEKREEDAIAEEERTNPMVALENRTKKSNQQMVMQENLEELYELAEKIGAEKGEMTKEKALNIIQASIAKDKELARLSLEEATEKIKEYQDEYRDEAARLGEGAETEEDDAQVQVREFLQEIDPSELLMLNMDEEETRFGPTSLAEDKKQKKLKDALDKTASKKKFAGLIKRPTTSGTSTKRGTSYKDYQDNLKKIEEKKKADAEQRKASLASLSVYGDSSSSGEEDNSSPKRVSGEAENESNLSDFKVPALPVHESSSDSHENDSSKPNLPPGFTSDPIDTPGVVERPKAGSKRKSSTEFGSNDFWSSITKKK